MICRPTGLTQASEAKTGLTGRRLKTTPPGVAYAICTRTALTRRARAVPESPLSMPSLGNAVNSRSYGRALSACDSAKWRLSLTHSYPAAEIGSSCQMACTALSIYGNIKWDTYRSNEQPN